ncbi:hypothetical protein VTO42DRAFT_5529 [Malbranchea cinnamomea]
MATAGPAPSAPAAYKKKDGLLTMAGNHQSITWTPRVAGESAFTIQVKDITNLQQTPASSSKVMLKIFAQPPNVETPQQYVFSFTSGPNARAEADKIRDALSAAISAVKSAAQTPAPTGGATSMAMASAATSTASSSARWLDDNNLRKDAELQQSLLRSDPNLQRVFMESLRTKPETVSSAQFVSQFWASRVHLLRAHAIERSQTRGAYNVLSTIKPRVEDNVTRLNISKEQIQLIFNQHPLVKQVYDENVPKLTEQQFWSRFFQSRLFKKLRGERISDSDATDSILDKYLRNDVFEGRAAAAHVPHFIDLEGNEENHSQRLGNRPYYDMRPSSADKVPIIRTLNSMSEKIMANVAPVDRDPSAAGDEGEDSTYRELELRDLRDDERQNRILLNIRDQSRFFAETKEADAQQTSAHSPQDPEVILNTLRVDLERAYPEKGAVNLRQLVEPEEEDDESDKEEGDHKKKEGPVGSKANMAKATAQVFNAIRERKAQSEHESSSATFGLSQAVYDRVVLTHATTTEFLRQFWNAFLSGNPDRAGEITSLVESLNRAMDRIKAVSDEAEAERQAEVERLKKHAREVLAVTGKNIRPNLKGVAGGAKVVQQLMGPTLNALAKATGEYQKALAQQTAPLAPPVAAP